MIDCHMKLKGVEGEAPHKDHKNEIALLNWSWHVANQSSSGTGGGSGVGRATPGEFTCSYTMDKSSIVVAKNCAAGKHIEEAVVTVNKSGDGQLAFLTITMKTVFVTSSHIGATAGGEIGNTVTMSYGEIEYAYKAQDDKGKLGGEVKFGWHPGKTEIK